jgi:hypothetical protein
MLQSLFVFVADTERIAFTFFTENRNLLGEKLWLNYVEGQILTLWSPALDVIPSAA